MKLERTKKGGEPMYVPPQLECMEVEVENGFAASSAANENWNETPGGGNF